MNKIYCFFLILFTTFSYGQNNDHVWIDSWGTYAPVSSYNGVHIPNVFHFLIHTIDNSPYQMGNWSLSVRLKGDITNGELTRIKPEHLSKFQLLFKSVSINRANKDGLTPSASNMGVITTPIPFSYSYTPLVPYSSYSLHSANRSTSMDLLTIFDMKVEAGAYLEEYKSWSEYWIEMEAEVRNRKGQVVAGIPFRFKMQIHPNDSPPVVPTYSFNLNPSASNVLLEFKTPSDYLNGVTEQKENAVSVVSSTPYTVQVQALSSTLTSANATLPIETVNVSMLRSSTQAITGTAPLSTAKQTLLTSGAHSDTRNFDLRYKITPPNMGSGFFNKPYETYSAIIVYSLTPQ